MRTGRSKPIFCTTCVGRTFLTSERNDGHEKPFCRGPDYNPDETRPPTGKEEWRRWEFVYSGNARVPCWIVRVPKDIIWGHGGLWSDNSVAMFAALYRMHFPLNAEGQPCPFSTGSRPQGPRHLKNEPGQTALTGTTRVSAR